MRPVLSTQFSLRAALQGFIQGSFLGLPLSFGPSLSFRVSFAFLGKLH